MDYYSTRNPEWRVGLKEAVLRSLPPDNGLYMPERIPVLGEEFWQVIRGMSFGEIGRRVAARLREIDDIAYLRYASEYYRFGTLEEFVEELSDLQARTKGVPNQQELFDEG